MSGFTTFLTVMAVLTAIAATVLAFIFIVPEKKGAKLKGIGKLLHDICNFKFLTLEKIMQALYIFVTVLAILMCWVSGIEALYWEEFGAGLLLMFVGPFVAFIGVRIAYEIIMMSILLVKNVIQINNKLKNQNDEAGADAFSMDGLKDKYFEAKPATAPVEEVTAAPVAPVAPVAPAAPVAAPAAPVAPVARFCAKCGASTVDGHCPNGCQ